MANMAIFGSLNKANFIYRVSAELFFWGFFARFLLLVYVGFYMPMTCSNCHFSLIFPCGQNNFQNKIPLPVYEVGIGIR